jgi:hypothetical protein
MTFWTRSATISLALLCSCATPDELADSNREVIREMAPLLEEAAAKKAVSHVDSEYLPRIEAMEQRADDGDKAVRMKLAEGLHDARDERTAMRSENAEQHSRIRDVVDRLSAQSSDADKALRDEVAKLSGRMEGTDEAIQQKSGVALGILTQTNLQIAQFGNQMRELRSEFSQYRQDEINRRSEEDRIRNEKIEAWLDAKWEREKTKLWDRGELILWLAGGIALAIAGVAGWLVSRKGKA